MPKLSDFNDRTQRQIREQLAKPLPSAVETVKVAGKPVCERKKGAKSGYNKDVVLAYFKEMGLPNALTEYQFYPERKWRFDFAFDMKNRPYPEDCCNNVALEVDGGIWIQGGHNRGAQIKKTWEKENKAQIMGWKILKCEPKDLCAEQTINLIKLALGLTQK